MLHNLGPTYFSIFPAFSDNAHTLQTAPSHPSSIPHGHLLFFPWEFMQMAINLKMPRINHPMNRLDCQSNLVSSQEASPAMGPSS